MNNAPLTDPRARRIGARIERRRDELGFTQQQLADVAKLSQAAISKWESGQALPTLTSLLKLKRALGLTDGEFSEWLEVAA